MNKEEKERCSKNWEWAKVYWKRKSKELKIEDWGFEKNHTKTCLAITNYTKKKVCISSYFLKGNSCNEKKIRNTILHEIAHIFAGYKNNHNSQWKKIALKIGCNAEVCGIMTYIPGNYLLYCPNRCFEREYFRKPKTDGRICLKCKSLPKLKTI